MSLDKEIKAVSDLMRKIYLASVVRKEIKEMKASAMKLVNDLSNKSFKNYDVVVSSENDEESALFMRRIGSKIENVSVEKIDKIAGKMIGIKSKKE